MTDEPLEVTFIVVTQIMELHFLLIEHEWRPAIAALSNDDVATATRVLRRSTANQNSLIAAWQMLDPMSPVGYARFRPPRAGLGVPVVRPPAARVPRRGPRSARARPVRRV